MSTFGANASQRGIRVNDSGLPIGGNASLSGIPVDNALFSKQGSNDIDAALVPLGLLSLDNFGEKPTNAESFVADMDKKSSSFGNSQTGAPNPPTPWLGNISGGFSASVGSATTLTSDPRELRAGSASNGDSSPHSGGSGLSMGLPDGYTPGNANAGLGNMAGRQQQQHPFQQQQQQQQFQGDSKSSGPNLNGQGYGSGFGMPGQGPSTSGYPAESAEFQAVGGDILVPTGGLDAAQRRAATAGMNTQQGGAGGNPVPSTAGSAHAVPRLALEQVQLARAAGALGESPLHAPRQRGSNGGSPPGAASQQEQQEQALLPSLADGVLPLHGPVAPQQQQQYPGMHAGAYAQQQQQQHQQMQGQGYAGYQQQQQSQFQPQYNTVHQMQNGGGGNSGFGEHTHVGGMHVNGQGNGQGIGGGWPRNGPTIDIAGTAAGPGVVSPHQPDMLSSPTAGIAPGSALSPTSYNNNNGNGNGGMVGGGNNIKGGNGGGEGYAGHQQQQQWRHAGGQGAPSGPQGGIGADGYPNALSPYASGQYAAGGLSYSDMSTPYASSGGNGGGGGQGSLTMHGAEGGMGQMSMQQKQQQQMMGQEPTAGPGQGQGLAGDQASYGLSTKPHQPSSRVPVPGPDPLAYLRLNLPIDCVAVAEGREVRTTIMIRNIPSRYTQHLLNEELATSGFRGCFDFCYLPVDFRNGCSMGYAFCNFIDPHDLILFVSRWSGRRWPQFSSRKRCELAFARIQGKTALVEHFQHSRTLLASPPYCRPVIFVSNGPRRGEPEQFPFRPGPAGSQPMGGPGQHQQQQLGAYGGDGLERGGLDGFGDGLGWDTPGGYQGPGPQQHHHHQQQQQQQHYGAAASMPGPVQSGPAQAAFGPYGAGGQMMSQGGAAGGYNNNAAGAPVSGYSGQVGQYVSDAPVHHGGDHGGGRYNNNQHQNNGRGGHGFGGGPTHQQQQQQHHQRGGPRNAGPRGGAGGGGGHDGYSQYNGGHHQQHRQAHQLQHHFRGGPQQQQQAHWNNNSGHAGAGVVGGFGGGGGGNSQFGGHDDGSYGGYSNADGSGVGGIGQGYGAGPRGGVSHGGPQQSGPGAYPDQHSYDHHQQQQFAQQQQQQQGPLPPQAGPSGFGGAGPAGAVGAIGGGYPGPVRSQQQQQQQQSLGGGSQAPGPRPSYPGQGPQSLMSFAQQPGPGGNNSNGSGYFQQSTSPQMGGYTEAQQWQQQQQPMPSLTSGLSV